MKSYLFLVISLALPAVLNAQTPGQPLLSAYKAVTIRLRDPNKGQTGLPQGLFRHFDVIDERPDTARIGIHTDLRFFNKSKGKHRQLVFAQNGFLELAGYLNALHARPGAPYTALIVLRTLWISDVNYIREDLVKDPDLHWEKTRIRLKAEIYAVKDGVYTPLFRYDSTRISDKMVNSGSGEDLAGMLDELADSSSILAGKKGASGRQLSLEDIRRFNQSRFEAPICRDSGLVNGVYMNFEEFKNNTPTVHDFEIKKEKNGLVLYMKEAGNSYYSHNAWGYCDGKKVYVMKDGMLYPAWKEGKAYYFFAMAETGATNSSQPGERYMPGTPGYTMTAPMGTRFQVPGTPSTFVPVVPIPKGETEQQHIFTIDMDTGKLF